MEREDSMELNFKGLEIQKWNIPINRTERIDERNRVICVVHCVKSSRIRSYSGPQFSAFGLNTERYSVFGPNAGKCELE